MKNIRQDVVDIVSEGTPTQVSGVGQLMPLSDENLVANWIAKV